MRLVFPIRSQRRLGQSGDGRTLDSVFHQQGGERR